ncbi:TadE/TadG family type IV pilus assembly protein [Vibrio quintilis]|uniref:TadE-like protein n=1 Tax=Vibrio quintilis TaxID=1117707 RepID=A0A1M7YS79_9VIBR|nr:TadE/TadG family type IV pilus assembly protein [Vibrio quintilis]SHO55473.1 TadE-like protein [Vibrio quintilis]
MKKMWFRQQGLAAVEFVIVIPVVLVLLVGIVEFGSALVRYNTLNKMVQNGARYAVTDIYGTASSDQIASVTSIKNMVLYGHTGTGTTPLLEGVTASDITVTHANKYVSVTVSYDYTPLLSIVPSVVMDMNFDLTATAVSRTSL